jgi:formylglycine-generating enzyme required for sulfatase activity
MGGSTRLRVTNAQFTDFVRATGYVTVVERVPFLCTDQ